MNRYKLKGVIEFLMAEASKLSGVLGVDTSVDELMVCFGLRELLGRQELAVVRAEMLDVIEAEAFLDGLRIRASV